MGKMIYCSSCGAQFDENAAKCPYCDSTNIKGAEREYFEKLEDVREELEELGDQAGNELMGSVKQQAKRFRKLAIVLLIFILAVLGLVGFSRYDRDKDLRGEYVWQAENFPKLDALYNEEKFDEMLDLYNEIRKEGSLYNWSHYDFVTDLTQMKDLEKSLDSMESGMNFYAWSNLMYSQWRAKGLLAHKKDYTEAEWSALEPVVLRSEACFEEIWHMSDEQMEDLMKDFRKNGKKYITYGPCDEFVKAWMKENQ